MNHFQEEQFFIHDHLGEKTAFLIPLDFIIESDVVRLNLETLESSLDQIIRRHEGLRTAFAKTRLGFPRRYVYPSAQPNLEFFDLSKCGNFERESRLKRICEDDFAKPFDLSRPPLMRTIVIQISPSRTVCLFTFHHIVMDGASLSVIMRELSQAYQTLTAGLELALPAVEQSFSDYVENQRRMHLEGTWNNQLTYWRAKSEGLRTATTLEGDVHNAAVGSWAGGLKTFVIEKAIADLVRVLAAAEGATVYQVLASAMLLSTARHSDSADVAIGTPVANRSSMQRSIVGPLVNFLLIRPKIDLEMSFLEFLHENKREIRQAFRNSKVPYSEVLRQAQQEGLFQGSTLFEVLFVFHSSPHDDLSLGVDLRAEPFLRLTSKSKKEFTLTIEERRNETLYCEVEYRLCRFTNTFIQSWIEEFCDLLRLICLQPQSSLRSLLKPTSQISAETKND